jgi:hypothetical protein
MECRDERILLLGSMGNMPSRFCTDVMMIAIVCHGANGILFPLFKFTSKSLIVFSTSKRLEWHRKKHYHTHPAISKKKIMSDQYIRCKTSSLNALYLYSNYL